MTASVVGKFDLFFPRFLIAEAILSSLPLKQYFLKRSVYQNIQTKKIFFSADLLRLFMCYNVSLFLKCRAVDSVVLFPHLRI